MHLFQTNRSIRFQIAFRWLPAKNITIGKSLQEAIKTSTLYYFERGKRSRTLFIDDLSATTFVVLVPAISLSNNHTVLSHHLSDLLVGG